MSSPSKLRNDCFALPAGVHWTPVSEALDLLEQRLQCCVPVETCTVEASDGRVWHMLSSPRDRIRLVAIQRWMAMLFLVVLRQARRVLNCDRGALLLARPFQVSSGPVKHCESSRARLYPRVPIQWSCKKTLR